MPRPLALRVGPIDAPAAALLGRKPRKPGRKPTYTDETIAASQRLRDKGVSLKDSAEYLGLTIEQVKYLRYTRPRQQGTYTGPDRKPLDEIVPDPVTAGHKMTGPNHQWLGEHTRYRSDLIRQVKACKGRGYKPYEVAPYFHLPANAVRYIWYQLADEEKKPEN